MAEDAAHICVLSPIKPASGNQSTATRIRGYFSHPNHEELLVDPARFQSGLHFNSFLQQHDVHCIIALHALHCSHILQDCTVPFILVFGGTDLNCDRLNPSHVKVMAHIVQKARYLVCFNKAMCDTALEQWPDTPEAKCFIIPQGVKVLPSVYPLKKYICNLIGRPLDSVVRLFTLVSGIRPVKDPLYLLDAFAAWHAKYADVYLLIIGPILDEELGKCLTAHLKKITGVIYYGQLSTEDTHAAIQHSDALVNCSLSEGMSSAILEAMVLGTPVIARAIPGNLDLIKHNHTGLLYDTPQSFVEQAENLMNNRQLRSDIIKNASDYVKQQHSCDNEKSSYKSLITSMNIF